MRQSKHSIRRQSAGRVEVASTADEARTRRRIDAFGPAWRPAIDRLARQSGAIEDLAESFPALLFAIATGYGTDAQRIGALTAVVEGLPLKEAARRLGLPMWLRKLPPGALNAPLVSPPAEPALVNRLVSLIPPQPTAAAAWLERVLIAHATGRADLTSWVAQTWRGRQPAARSASFLGVLGWAWFCQTHRQSRAGAMLRTSWSPTIGAARAIKEAGLWKERLALEVCLGNGLTDTWLEAGRIGDLAFVPLRTAQDMIGEAEAMDNCLDRYADRLAGRTVRIFSVRRDGRSIADVEIAPHEREPGHPVIAQLRGPHNRRAPLEVWRAAYAWLGSQPLRIADASLEHKVGPTTRARRAIELWAPFIEVLPENARTALEAHVTGRRARRPARAAASASPGS